MELRSKKEIAKIRKAYPAGTRIVLEHMDDRNSPPPGTAGTVRGVDAMGEILIWWDNGTGFMLMPGIDTFHVEKKRRAVRRKAEPAAG